MYHKGSRVFLGPYTNLSILSAMKKLTGQKLQNHDKNWQPVPGNPYSSLQKIMDAGYIKLNDNGVPGPDAIGYYDELILNR